jgi:pyrroloquinoline quinone biosynthesis protein B
MKLVVLKGGDDSVPLAQVNRAGVLPSRAAGAAALSGDGQRWVLLNVSPLVADQLASDARLLRHHGLPDAALRAVVLTDAQVDHVTGLLSLRDGAPIHLYATPAVFEELTHELPVLPLLQHYCGVHWHVIPVAGECREAVFRVEGQPTLEFTAIATDGPRPRHAARPESPAIGETIALAVRDLVTGQRLFSTNRLSGAGPGAMEWMREADCVLVGGEPEPAREGAGTAGPVPDVLALLDGIRAQRKLLMCRAEWAGAPCAEAGALARRGIEVAADRMEIEL